MIDILTLEIEEKELGIEKSLASYSQGNERLEEEKKEAPQPHLV